MSDPIQIKQGDSFDFINTIPASFPDGHFVGWTVSSQVRNPANGSLIADLDASWIDPVTTRQLKLLKIDTKSWPLSSLEFDVQFVRVSDGYTLSTETSKLKVTKDCTE
jgi:hypothetical protein